MNRFLHVQENNDYWFKKHSTRCYTVQNIFRRLKKGNFFLNYPHEYTWPHVWNQNIKKSKVYKKIKLNFLVGIDIDKTFIRDYFGVYEENINVTSWPTYWFNTGIGDMHLYQEHNPNPFELSNYNFDKTFICMNGKVNSKLHRILLIDAIHKYGLENNGYLTVLEIPKQKNVYKYWKPEIKTFSSQQHYTYDKNDTRQKKINRARMYLPEEWYKAPIHIVPETFNHLPFDDIYFTEKTSYCLAMLKPFIIVGQQYSHKKLKDYGFKLYDSIFDYEFDSYEKLTDRISAVVTQIKNLCTRDVNELWHSTREVAEYNLKKLVEVSKNTIPNNVYNNGLDKEFGKIVMPGNVGRQNIFDFTNFKFYNKNYL